MENYRNATAHRLFRNYACSNCKYFKHDEEGYYRAQCTRVFNPDYDEIVKVYTPETMFYMCNYGAMSSRAHYCVDDDNYHFMECAYDGSTGDYVTADYAREYLNYCHECGSWYSDNDFNFSRNMCNTCARDYSIIGSWHDNKGNFETVATSTDTDRDRRLTIGYEWEIDHTYYDNDRNNDTAYWIDSNYLYHFVFENDCSLNYGYEIITQPHTYSALEKLDIEAIADYLKKQGYISHDTSTCGLHVHFSTNWLGDTDSEKRQTLYNVIMFYEYNFENMLTLSRRENYRSYADRNSCENDFDIYTDDYENILDANIHGDRYCAVNCTNFYRGCNESTIEFRLGRGTLNANTLRAWIDIHIAIINYCRNNSDYENFAGIFNYCSQRARDYIRNKLY